MMVGVCLTRGEDRGRSLLTCCGAVAGGIDDEGHWLAVGLEPLAGEAGDRPDWR